MALDQVNNFGKSTVTTGYSNSATSIIVTDGSRFPDPASGAYNVVWWNSTDYFDPSDDPNREIVRVTGKSSNTLTVTRGQESTSATSKNTTDKTYTMILAPTAKMITDIGTSLDTKVTGPGSSTDNAIVRWDGTTGYLDQNSVVTINDAGVMAGASISGSANTITNVPISTGVSGLGTGVATFLATPSSANLAAAVTDETGSGSLVFATSPTLVTPILGTPTSGTLTNCTGLPISTGVSGLGTGVATFLATPSSANLAAAVTDETGSGSLVFATSPTLVTPNLGTPSAATLTNATGLPLSTGVTGQLPLANGGTGANLVDPNADRLMFWDDSAGNVDWLTLGTNLSITGTTLNASGGGGGGTPGGSDTQLQYNNAGAFGGITGATTNGTSVTLTSPTFVTPVLGTPSSGTLTNCTGLPISSGVSGLGANVATFLATPSSANLAAAVTDETGSGSLVFATSPTLVTPILGTPTSGTLTNCTGLPISSGVSGLGTNVATFLATPSSANLASAVTDETGSGSLVFGTSPSLTTPKVITSLNDTNANEIFVITATGSAVNELTVANAATGNNPSITASGSDTDVGIDIQSKGADPIRLNNSGGNVQVGGGATASELRFMEPSGSGSNYTAFKAQAQSGNVTYTLPAADGTANYVLKTDGSGNLSWTAQTGGGGGVTLGLVNAVNTGVVLA